MFVGKIPAKKDKGKSNGKAVVRVASCQEVHGILEADSLPDGTDLIENVPSYPWSIETKYYTADVLLCTTEKRTIVDQNFAACVEAFVVYFDPEEEVTFHQMNSWLPYLDQLEPDIKLLVCDRCTESTKVSRLVAQTWCIDHWFELKELSSKEQSDSETEDNLDQTLFKAQGQDDPGGQSFEELFEKFASMKERANSLPPDERKK